MSIDVGFQILSRDGVRSLARTLALVATLLAHPVAAQAPMKDVIDVRVTNIEIIATDSNAHHVPGLTRDDFELYENGKLQPITNLFEAAAGAADSGRRAAMPRRLVFYLDDMTLLPNNRKLAVAALKKLVADTMKPEDQVMIVTFNRRATVRLPWTSEGGAVQSALDLIGREAGGGTILRAARSRIERDIRSVLEYDRASSQTGSGAPRSDFRGILSGVRNYASSVKHDFGLSAAALQNLFVSLAGVDGRKIVFIVSESFPTRPGGEAFAYLENVRQQILSGDASPALKQGAATASVNLDASEFNTNETILMLGRIANAAGVTIYALDPDTSGRSDSGNVEQTAPDQMPAGVAAGSSGVDGLQILAQATGGVAWISVKPGVAIEKLRADLENYYSIGFQATAGGEAERAIEVRAKRGDIRVRAQKRIVVRTAEAEMPDRVTSNLHTAQLNDLGISVQVAGDVLSDGGKRRVPVRVMIPARNLTVVPEGDVFTGGFSVYICTAGGKPEPSGVNRQSHQIRWLPSAIAQLNDRQVIFAVEVVLEKGRDQISVGVLDHRSQVTGFSKIAM